MIELDRLQRTEISSYWKNLEKVFYMNLNNVEEKTCAIVAEARSCFSRKLKKFWDDWRFTFFLSAAGNTILEALLAVIFRRQDDEPTMSALEFYKQHAFKLSKLKEEHEELLAETRCKVEEQIQGKQNQVEAMKRIEAALYEIGKDIFLDEVWKAAEKAGYIGGSVSGVAAGAAAGALLGPVGAAAGAGIGLAVGYFAGRKVGKKAAFEAWRR